MAPSRTSNQLLGVDHRVARGCSKQALIANDRAVVHGQHRLVADLVGRRIFGQRRPFEPVGVFLEIRSMDGRRDELIGGDVGLRKRQPHIVTLIFGNGV